ncbi:MAG: YqaA family protein [Beijerinckiaceae bacterium]
MLKRAYDWIVSYASHPRAALVLFAVTFIESSISPIPPLPLLIPMCLANPKRSWYYALVCTAGACAGGFVGYGIGHLLYDTLGLWIINLYGLAGKAQELISSSNNYWFWVLVTKGLTPIPFKIVTIMSGFLNFSLPLFFVGMFVSRLTFFFMFAIAIQFYGENIRTFIERHLPLTTGILLFFLIGGFFVLPLVL